MVQKIIRNSAHLDNKYSFLLFIISYMDALCTMYKVTIELHLHIISVHFVTYISLYVAY